MMRPAIPTPLVIHFLCSLMPVPVSLGWLAGLMLTSDDGLNPTWTDHVTFIVYLLLLVLVPVGLCFASLRFVWGKNPEARGLLSGRKMWWISVSTLIPLVAMAAVWVFCTMVLRDEGFAMLGSLLSFHSRSSRLGWCIASSSNR